MDSVNNVDYSEQFRGPPRGQHRPRGSQAIGTLPEDIIDEVQHGGPSLGQHLLDGSQATGTVHRDIVAEIQYGGLQDRDPLHHPAMAPENNNHGQHREETRNVHGQARPTHYRHHRH